MSIGLIDKTITEKLTESEIFNGWTIESFPENFKSYNFTSALGCLLIKYNSTAYSKPDTISAITQDATYEFSVVTGLRYIERTEESYPVLDEIYQVLPGLQINGKKMYPTQCNYIGRKDGDIYYESTFKITLPVSSPNDKNNIYNMTPFARTRKA